MRCYENRSQNKLELSTYKPSLSNSLSFSGDYDYTQDLDYATRKKNSLVTIEVGVGWSKEVTVHKSVKKYRCLKPLFAPPLCIVIPFRRPLMFVLVSSGGNLSYKSR